MLLSTKEARHHEKRPRVWRGTSVPQASKPATIAPRGVQPRAQRLRPVAVDGPRMLGTHSDESRERRVPLRRCRFHTLQHGGASRGSRPKQKGPAVTRTGGPISKHPCGRFSGKERKLLATLIIPRRGRTRCDAGDTPPVRSVTPRPGRRARTVPAGCTAKRPRAWVSVGPIYV